MWAMASAGFSGFLCGAGNLLARVLASSPASLHPHCSRATCGLGLAELSADARWVQA